MPKGRPQKYGAPLLKIDNRQLYSVAAATFAIVGPSPEPGGLGECNAWRDLYATVYNALTKWPDRYKWPEQDGRGRDPRTGIGRRAWHGWRWKSKVPLIEYDDSRDYHKVQALAQQDEVRRGQQDEVRRGHRRRRPLSVFSPLAFGLLILLLVRVVPMIKNQESRVDTPNHISWLTSSGQDSHRYFWDLCHKGTARETGRSHVALAEIP